jgi:hypothetical protein
VDLATSNLLLSTVQKHEDRLLGGVVDCFPTFFRGHHWKLLCKVPKLIGRVRTNYTGRAVLGSIMARRQYKAGSRRGLGAHAS